MPTLGNNDIGIVISTSADDAGIKQATKAVETLQQRAGRLASDLKTFGRNMSTFVTLPLIGVAGGALKLASDMEQTEVAFTTMMGNADAAREHLKELKDFAAKTPFEFSDLTRMSRSLQAMGFEAKRVRPLMTAVGDVVASLGGGSAELDRVTRALGQMQSKTKVSAEEMLQLAEIGIPAWKILADATGLTVAEVQKLSEQGEISADVFIDAFERMEGPLSKFTGGMAAQSETAAGKWSTLKDAVSELGRTVGDDFLPIATQAIEKLTQLAQWFSTLDEGTQKAIIGFGVFAAAVGPVLIAAGTLIDSFLKVRGAITAVELATKAMNGGFSMLPTAIVISVALAGFAKIMSEIKQLQDETNKMSQDSEDTSNHMLNKLKELRSQGKITEDQYKKFAADAISSNMQLQSDLANIRSKAFDLKSIFSWENAKATLGMIGSMFGGQRATGGPVMAGKTYLVGENGPELFTATQGGHIANSMATAERTSTAGAVNITNYNTFVRETDPLAFSRTLAFQLATR